MAVPSVDAKPGDEIVVTIERKPRRPARPPADLTADLTNYDPFEPVVPPEDWEALR